MTPDPRKFSLSKILAYTLKITEADSGHIQLLDPVNGHLNSLAQIGLSQAFLDFVGAVDAGDAAGQTLLQRSSRIWVTDVEQEPTLAGTPTLKVLRDAGIRAVQSTPLWAEAGECLGVLSIYYRTPVHFDARMSRVLDLMAWLAVNQILRRQAEATQATREERYRTLIETIDVITWSCPPSGLHIEPQPAWMEFTGQTAEEMMGAGWTKAIHPDDCALVLKRWIDSVASGSRFSSEHRIRHRDGSWRWMKVTGIPLRDDTSQVTEWFAICIDRTEQKVSEEARYELSQLVEKSTQFVGILDPDFFITYLNEAAMRLLGLDALDQVRGRHILELIHPDHRGTWLQTAILSMQAGKPIELEIQLRRFQGNAPVWVRQLVEPIKNKESLLSGYSIFAADVSDSRQARADLSDSELRFHSLFETASVGVTLTDTQMKFVAANQRYSDITGYSIDELLHMGPMDMSLPENRERERFEIRDTISRHEPVKNFERPLRRRDGSIAWVRFNASLVRNNAGRILGIIAVTDDITEERKSSLALREREAWIASIFENVPVGLAIFDASGKSILSNREARRLVPDGLVVQGDDRRRQRWRAHRPDGSELPIEEYPVNRALRGEIVDDAVELQHVEDDGAVTWYMVRAVALRNPDGRFGGVLAVADDITERKRVAESLYQSRKMQAIGTLASSVAHDSNNLLGAVRLNLELVSQHVHEPEAVTALQRAMSALDAGKKQNAKLMTMGGGPSLVLAPVNLNDCVREALAFLEGSLANGIEILTSLWPAPNVDTNPRVRIRQ